MIHCAVCKEPMLEPHPGKLWCPRCLCDITYTPPTHTVRFKAIIARIEKQAKKHNFAAAASRPVKRYIGG